MGASSTGSSGGHVPVLMEPVLGLLSPGEGEVYVDCTAGLGGHAAAMAGRVGAGGVVVVNDADSGNVERSRERVEGTGFGGRVEALVGNFADVGRRVVEAGLSADMVLADLGFASSQMEDASRGLSFGRDGPLDMRYDRSRGATAAELVNGLDEAELAGILWEFGEERGSRRIASKIVAERASSPIETTARLASIVRSVLGPRGGGPRVDPATRTFQALRIAVNDELGSLGAFLESVRRAAFVVRSGSGASSGVGCWLSSGARVGVISFHSLEDRMVKRAFADLEAGGLGRRLTRGVVEADAGEVSSNPRSRSARFRVVRIGVDG